MAMGISRMLDQNVYFWLVSGLQHGIPGLLAAQDWGNVKVVAGYPSDVESLTLPTAAVVRDSNSDSPQQLGSSTTIIRTDTYAISVFTQRDGQRDDLAEYVKDLVDSKDKRFLDYNSGFSPTGGQPQLGTIYFELVGMFPVREMQAQTRAHMHRMDVRFTTEYVYDTLS